MHSSTFHILTFGCQMNVRDSQWLNWALTKRGLQVACLESADIVIINTCSVREKPEQKIASVLRRLEQLPRKDQGICILGCVAQQLGKKLFANDKRICLVAGGDSIAHVPDALQNILKNPDQKLHFLDFSSEYTEREQDHQNNTSAYVNIMQGCDNFCAYCIVPYTRGRQRSRSLEAIHKECKLRIEEGALEITLLGQNVNAWGKDSGQGYFYDLLEKIAHLPGLCRLHFISAHPRDMTKEVVEAFGNLPNLCPRLHLPLQAGSDSILSKMRRGYDSASFLRLVEDLHRARTDIALSTDLIVGFPGETESDFQATLDMLRQCGFISSYSFCYSDRPGTRASIMPDKVHETIKHERLLRLQELQEEIGQEWLKKRIGRSTSVLVESKSPRQNGVGECWQGRDIYGVPVNVEAQTSMGKLLNVEITASKKHSLIGKVIN